MDINALIKQIVALTKKLNKQQKTIIVVTLVVIVGLISFLIVYNSSASKIKGDDGYRVLFENLQPADAALIAQELDKNKIPYKLPRDGTIEVKKEMVQKVRLQVASLGLPKESKVGFQLFDKQEFGATKFEQNIKYLRAIEGELSSTIQSIRAVKNAKVNIAIPKESLFVSQQSNVTASVMIELEPNMILSPKQIKGIKYLVSAAIPKLKPDNVKIINQYGDLLGENDELTSNNELLKAELIYKKRYEKVLQDKIIDILSPIVGGRNKVVAKVDVDFDFSKVKSKAEIFSPDNVVRSEQTMEEKKEGYSPKQVGGVPGAVSNIGPVQGLKSGGIKEKYNKSTTTTNYEISTTIKDIKEPLAKIKRITAAVVVDGHYKINKDGKKEFVPLSKIELANIENLVKNTIGFDPKRGDSVSVSSFQFTGERNGSESTSKVGKIMQTVEMYLGPLSSVFKYLFLVLVLFLFYKKVITPFTQKMLEVKVEEEHEYVKPEVEIDEEEVETTYDKIKELKEKVEQQLGISSDVNEEELKYEVLLERVSKMAEEKTEEVAKVLENLIKEETNES